MRLCAYVAKSTRLSRRQAGEYIKSGKIKVNGHAVFSFSYEVKADDIVELDGRRLKEKKPLYLAFHKPVGVVSVFKDKFAARKLSDFIPASWGKLYPVGRLDKNSRGLMLLTNDGDFCFRISHPRFRIEKEYEVEIGSALSASDAAKIKKGIREGGEVLRAEIIKVCRLKKRWRVSLVLRQGRKREIRRIFKKLGIAVWDLKRVRIGGIRLGRLPPGKYRFLSQEEVEGQLR